MDEYQREYTVSVGERPWGEYIVLLNGDDHKVKEITVNPGHAIHRIANHGDTDLIFIEIQTGDYFGEDDIERLEDDYARG